MKTIRYQNRGFAVLSTLFIIAAISLMLGMLIKIGGQRAFTAKRLADQVKALAYAEAGVDYAYSIISQDFEERNNSDLSTETTYAEGSYTLTLTSVDDKYVIINSVGKCGAATKIAEILVDDENAGSGGSTPAFDYSSMEGFNYAVLSGGTFNFGGSGLVSGLKMHSNSAIDIRGNTSTDLDITSSTEISTGNVTVDGSVTAPTVDLHNKATITDGATEAAVPPVTIPDIDLTPYLSWAEKNGEVHNGFSTSSSYTPVGGVLWVNGDVQISSHAVINGSIIATGNIYISGSVDINPTTTTFAMASRDGDITNTSSGTLNGLIYAKSGDYSQTANGTLIGQLIVNGTIKKGGNSDIINYVRSVPTPPGGPGSTSPTTAWPVISAWQK
jgi:cytoskeletal protein CcmA (bactofilin family)